MESSTRKGLAENHTSDPFQGFVVLELGVGKAPAFQFYPSDWSRDLEEHPLEIEGAWIRICCKLWWAEPRGKLTRTLDQWAKILRTNITDAKRILEYVMEQQIGNIIFDHLEKMNEIQCASCVTGNALVTVMSRRMIRDEKVRDQTKLRVQRHREKQPSNAPVTQSVTQMKHDSSSSSSSSCTKVHKNKTPSSSDDDGLFDAFWRNYPKKVGKEAARKAWHKIKNPKEVIEKLKIVLPLQKKSDQWLKDDGQYIPHPATYLNQGRWEDEPDGDKETYQRRRNLLFEPDTQEDDSTRDG